MKLHVRHYYLFVVLLFTVAMTLQDVEIGLRYIIFFALNVVMLYFTRKSHQLVMMILLGTLFLAYFLRGFVVALDHSMFSFITLFPIDRATVLWSFDTALIGSFALSIGLLITSFRLSDNTRNAQNKSSHPYFLSSFWVIWIALFLLAMLKVLLIKYGGVGLKSVQNTGPLGFLLALVPMDLPFVVLGIYLFKYFRELDAIKKIMVVLLLCFFSYSVLLSGSKTFIMAFALCYGIYLLYVNAKIRVTHFAFLIVLGIGLSTISFALANAVRASFYAPHLTTTQILKIGLKYFSENDLTATLSEVTVRFNGFDGQIKYQGMQSDKQSVNLAKVQQAFKPKILMLNYIEGLVPKVNLTDEHSAGVAIGKYIERVGLTKPYAGALGIVAASMVAGGKFYAILLFIAGLAIGIMVKLANYIRHPDLQFIVIYIIAYFCMLFTMSGNIDSVLIDLTIKSGLLLFFVYLFGSISGVKSMKSRNLQLST